MSEMEVDDTDPLSCLRALRAKIEPTNDAELIGAFYEMEDLYDRKLWYQLSELLSKMVYKNENSRPIRLRLFEKFITSFANKINQLKLVQFMILSLEDSTPSDSLKHLDELKDRITEYGKSESKQAVEDDINDNEVIQALIFVEIESARVKIAMDQTDEAVAMMDECQKKIDNLTGSVDNRVNASYYRTNSQLMKINGDYSSYYYSSLLFLACIDNLDDLENRPAIVRQICVSGLLGERIYNFGEIIMHQIFNDLQEAWLKELVISLNNGDLTTFQKVINSSDINSIPEIASHRSFLEQKMCIMAFIEIIFSKPTNNKNVQYSQLLKQIPLLKSDDDVERMVMKCLGLGLIKGHIDQVHSSVEITWIQPHTMTMDQIVNMKRKMTYWSDRVQQLDGYMNESGKGLWVED